MCSYMCKTPRKHTNPTTFTEIQNSRFSSEYKKIDCDLDLDLSEVKPISSCSTRGSASVNSKIVKIRHLAPKFVI